MNHSGQMISAAASHGYSEPVPAPANPLPSALESLGYSINDLAATVDTMRGRLDRVLAPTAPTTGNAGNQLKGVVSASSQMVEEVQAQRDRIQMITSSVHEMLARLEV